MFARFRIEMHAYVLMDNHYRLLIKPREKNHVMRGLIYSSQDFEEKIKERFLLKSKDDQLPQNNSMFAPVGSNELLRRASDLLDYDPEISGKSSKTLKSEMEKRDFLIYFLRDTGRFTNRQVGAFFDLTYSSVSQSVRILNSRKASDKSLKRTYENFKPQMQV